MTLISKRHLESLDKIHVLRKWYSSLKKYLKILFLSIEIAFLKADLSWWPNAFSNASLLRTPLMLWLTCDMFQWRVLVKPSSGPHRVPSFCLLMLSAANAISIHPEAQQVRKCHCQTRNYQIKTFFNQLLSLDNIYSTGGVKRSNMHPNWKPLHKTNQGHKGRVALT